MRTALWVVPVHRLAGVARHVLDVTGAGIPGWRLVVLTPPGLLPQRLREAGAAVIEQPFGPEAGLRASVATLRHAVSALRPDLAHSHLSFADLALAAAAPRGLRLVTTEHGIAADDAVYHSSRLTGQAMAAAHALRLRRFDTVIAVSGATARAMREKWRWRGPVEVVRNGVDRPPVRRRDPGLRILSLARLAPEKRLDRLLEAMVVLREDHPEASLTLAGVGPEHDRLAGLAGDLGLDGAVRLPGYLDSGSALAGHDVLALLSVWENCSYALLDAAASGLGVVASRVGGNPEILPERCLVDAEDAAAVAGALARQGQVVDARPGLADWPDVPAMCAGIAAAYGGAR